MAKAQLTVAFKSKGTPAPVVRGYWSSVFYQATLLMKTRQGITGEVAFWLARDIVDQNAASLLKGAK